MNMIDSKLPQRETREDPSTALRLDFERFVQLKGAISPSPDVMKNPEAFSNTLKLVNDLRTEDVTVFTNAVNYLVRVDASSLTQKLLSPSTPELTFLKNKIINFLLTHMPSRSGELEKSIELYNILGLETELQRSALPANDLEAAKSIKQSLINLES